MSRLTPNAAAELCGKSRATILRAITTEDLPATKIGGQWAIERKLLSYGSHSGLRERVGAP